MVEAAGFVQRIVYNSGDFYVLNFFVVDSEQEDGAGQDGVARNLTVRGNIFGLLQLRPDVPVRLIGVWRKHRKYGVQFAIQSWEPWATSEEHVHMFLTTCIEGASPAIVDALVAQYGLETFQRLTNEPQTVLRELAHLDEDALQRTVLGWETALATRDLSGLLKDGGLNSVEIQSAFARFGTQAGRIVRENPFRLMEIPGQSFVKIDKLALHLGGTSADPRRIEGAVLWALQYAMRSGHLFLRRGQIAQAVVDAMAGQGLASLPLREDPAKAFETAVSTLASRKAVVLEEGVGVYLNEPYRYERESAEMMAKLLTASHLDVDLEAFFEEYERANGIQLSEAQRKAVETLAEHRVLVLTGLPGTGKTTAVRALVRLFEEAGVGFSLMAPTGIAAKRVAAVTGHEASTIHRALRYDGQNWGHGASNHYVVDAVIVDEVSMVDQELIYRLLSALRSDTILVLVGDDAQLPSVGPGQVLRELVESKSVPNVRLTQIFRQAEKGEIVVNSHRINRGEMPTLVDPKQDTEFKFVRVTEESRIVDLICKMAGKLKTKDANFQVLSPKYDGLVGVNNLNKQLREELNPEGAQEWSQGLQHFRLGDRLMVVQNDYERNVYNGDVGKLVRIERDSLVVKIHDVVDGMDMEVSFTFSAAEEKLRLAYAITVHKCQGSEFDTIIMPIVRSQGRMLQRNLLYTAITRAKKRVWLIGEETAIQQAIQNNKVVKRNTLFSASVEKALIGVQEEDANRDPSIQRSDGRTEESPHSA